ncbi:flagellar biosynthesis anti-sigma factor FlgM [Pseudohalioglobus lutimaris]|uniref:Negative regulator of flagellin synthesis n=1 Tax=Pseudohalioglobus lutimaris TaxID=1737061 RepID=A0A2N5X1P8_9GAMM|nr:flagellar biosynthesis anti-sigma factor FlgM [Pseudohalioglobus lutimaris]PLW68411.1 flagellar biosynthesis anti-sigma factor FlgM [Pseudohalioglobus lutimaris]
MKNVDNNMNIRPSRGDLEQSSQTSSRVTDNSASPAAGSSPKKAEGDKVTFTGIATEMRSLEADLARIPEVDSDRVNAIKASIAEGNYEVNPEKILKNLLDLEQALSR